MTRGNYGSLNRRLGLEFIVASGAGLLEEEGYGYGAFSYPRCGQVCVHVRLRVPYAVLSA